MLRSSKVSRWLVWGIFGLALLGFLGSLALDLAGCAPAQTLFAGTGFAIFLITVIPPLLFSLLGVLIITYQRGNRIGWILLLLGLTFTYTPLLLDYGMCAYRGIFDLPGGVAALWLFNVVNLFFTAALILFINLFPDGQFLSPRWQRFALLSLAAFFAFKLLALFWPGPILPDLPNLASDLQNPYALPLNAAPAWNTFVRQGPIVSGFLCSLVTFLALFARWRQAQGDVRQQLKWLVLFFLTAGASFVIIEFVGYTIYPPIFESWFYLFELTVFFLGLPIILGLAIFKYRLYDVDIIINRTLVYGGLSITIVACYVLVVAGLGALFQSQASIVLALPATGLIAVLFQPVRDWLQKRVNRLMFGDRDDPYVILSKLSTQLQTTATPAATLQSVVETVAETLKLPYVAIELSDAQGALGGAATGSSLGNNLTIPLRYQNEAMGRLVVSPRSPTETFNERDQRLLADIAAHTGPMAHTVRLTAALQRSREMLILTREEERRRIRRDLHDGLGPVLAGQSLKLGAARQLLSKNPAETGRLLDEVIQQNETTVSEVRRLVHKLRPPALDDLGLVTTIEQEGRHLMGPVQLTIDAAPDPFPDLPAAVEVAAFRIVMEALNNVSRHARASHCRVCLTVEESFIIEVSDDGSGIPAEQKPGVGLTSMRERAEELGGAFFIEASTGGGTHLKVSLPC